MSNYKTDVTIILPSLNPDEKFYGVVNELVEAGFQDIVIVNDGSDPDHMVWFQKVSAYEQCTVLNHEVNKGKGRALKTAFTFVNAHRPHSKGVVTIDGDGQHLTKDIIACAEAMLEKENKVIMGCRDFSLPDIPARSRGGNKFTSMLFLIGCGIRLSDTQTGLRAIPKQYLAAFSEIKGERFEYETNMLLMMKRMGIEFEEVGIETVYEGDNEGSHFRPIVDSLKIMKLIFVFMLSGVTSSLLDMGIFYLALKVVPDGKYAIFAATIIARALSSFYNFNVNRKVVFGEAADYKQTLVRYYCLCVVQTFCSATLVSLVKSVVPGGDFVSTLIKFLVDTLLFFASFTIQREWVFKK